MHGNRSLRRKGRFQELYLRWPMTEMGSKAASVEQPVRLSFGHFGQRRTIMGISEYGEHVLDSAAANRIASGINRRSKAMS